MDAGGMLDIIHVFFEEDTLPRWEQDIEVKDSVRKVLYRELYGEEYKYGHTSAQGRSAEWDFDGPPPANTSIYDPPAEGEIKPYFPPSTEEELLSILGPPVGS